VNNLSHKPSVPRRQTPDRARALSSPPGSLSSRLLYLYGIIESNASAHKLLSQGRIPGLDSQEPLFPIESDGLVAAVSRVPVSSFEENTLNDMLTDISRVAPYAVKHQQALQALADAAPALIPLAFGAVYRSPDNILQLLNARGQHFRRILSQVKDKQEWSVKVYQDPALLQKAVESQSSQGRRLALEIDRSAPGRAYILRKQRQLYLANEAESVSRDVLDTLTRRLAEHSAASSLDSIPEVQPGPSRLVCKASFLVGAEHLHDFQDAARLSESHQSLGFSLELDGPWPPYSFVGDKSALL
jgi:hypothetical protein